MYLHKSNAVKLSGCGAVASVPVLGTGGRRFKSFHPDQFSVRFEASERRANSEDEGSDG